MIKGLTLSSYLGRQFLLWLIVFFIGLTGIIYLFEVAELLRRTADQPHTTFDIVLRMAGYKLPETIDKILPFVVLFSGMFTFWRLTKSQELIIARAAGVSAWQFLAPALIVTLAFGIVNLTIISPLNASMTTKYEEMEAKYLKRGLSLELTGAGLWLRQEEADKSYLLHADQVSLDPLTLQPLIIFVYDKKFSYLGRIDASKGSLKGNTWIVKDAWFNWNNQPASHEDEYKLPTSLTYEKIQESMAAPSTISFWNLPRFIKSLHSIGLPSARHELKLQALLAEPILLCAMVFFAAAFSLRLNRRGGILNAMMAGMFVGSAVFSLNNVVSALGINQTLPVVVAAWTIPILALLAGQATLLYLEDG